MNDEDFDGIYWGEYDDGTTWWDYATPAPDYSAYNGLGSYYEEMLGPGWEAQFTPSQLAEISRLSNMNDDDLSTNDDTQTGGFWNDLFSAFGNTLGNAAGQVGSAAINAAQQNAILAIKKKLPATTQQTATPATGTTVFGMDQKSAITLGIVALLGLLALRAS